MRKQSPQKMADAFNASFPIGTPVKYYRGAMGDESTSGLSVTSTAAEVLGGHTAVIWLEGVNGCIALTHIGIGPAAGHVRTCGGCKRNYVPLVQTGPGSAICPNCNPQRVQR